MISHKALKLDVWYEPLTAQEYQFQDPLTTQQHLELGHELLYDMAVTHRALILAPDRLLHECSTVRKDQLGDPTPEQCKNFQESVQAVAERYKEVPPIINLFKFRFNLTKMEIAGYQLGHHRTVG